MAAQLRSISTLLLLVLTASQVLSYNMDSGSSDPDEQRQQKFESQLKQKRLAHVKRTLERHLGGRVRRLVQIKPPDRSVLSLLQRDSQQQTEVPQEEETSIHQILVVGELVSNETDATRPLTNATYRYQFRLPPSTLQSRRIKSAKLLFKRHSPLRISTRRFSVRVIGVDESSGREERVARAADGDVLEADVTDLVRRGENHVLELGLRDGPRNLIDRSSELKTVYMQVRLHPGPVPRKRRSICDSGSQGNCCKRDFHVNFTKLGWDHYILEPETYNAGVCVGPCQHIGGNSVKLTRTHVMRQMVSNFTECCAPTKLSSISMVILEGNGTVTKRDVPGMVVEQCQCL